MIRYILLALFIYIAYRVVKNIRSMSTFTPLERRNANSKNTAGGASNIWSFLTGFTKRTVKKQQTIGEPQELIACTKCGTFVLKANALTSNGAIYCSQSCMDH